MSFLEGDRTGSWSKAFSRIVSMAADRGEAAGMVVTGLRRRVRTVAPLKGSLDAVGVRAGEGGFVEGGVGGRRSLAASQSSSTN